MPPLPVPYIPNFQNFVLDDFVVFIVSALLAIMVHAEGQAFAAMALGDTENKSDRFHFNAFLHLDIWGSLCFFLAGFGWPRKKEIDADRFEHPRLYGFLARLGGPAANFLLASIAGSIVWLMTIYGQEDRVFTMVVIVNATVAVYSLLPIPPLAGFAVLPVFFPEKNPFMRYFRVIGPFLLLAVFFLERMTGLHPVSSWLDPPVRFLFHYIVR
ncbi:MAG: site-2 protease family protein [Desulfococcaceae bacterium]|jgi:Zn-dependent protease|nr:site-2 protease family protein [Desulfococcaceae bacterium]